MSNTKVFRAGIIPYVITPEGVIEMMFMLPSNEKYGGPLYQCAKGRVEEDETSLDTALREGYEELGLLKENICDGPNYLGVFLGRTTMYVAKVKDKETFAEPHFETGSVTWMTLEQFLREGRGLHKSIVKEAIKLIECIEMEPK